jgi:hypothetical protein
VRLDYDRNTTWVGYQRSGGQAQNTCAMQLSKCVRSMEQLIISDSGCDLPRWPRNRPNTESM